MIITTYIVLLTASLACASLAYRRDGDFNDRIVSDGLESSHRRKRAVSSLSPLQIEELLTAHNALRAKEAASDMKYLVWHDVMAGMAQEWADRCVFEHGNPAYPGNVGYDYLGQNLYYIPGDAINLTSAIQAFYDEKAYYNYETLTCSPNQVCGHYTQVVWAETLHVGCGLTRCWPNSDLGHAQFLVCNYGPSGNYADTKPYKKGDACSKCSFGQSWCEDGLCRRQDDCELPSSNCVCRAQCHNCATFDATTCSCACADGWQATDCTEVCEDFHDYCRSQWPASWCDEPGAAYVKQNCPKLCGLCIGDGLGWQCDAVGPGLSAPPSIPSTTTESRSTTSTSSPQDGTTQLGCRLCEDHVYCGQVPGWPIEWCSHDIYGDEIRSVYCPIMCSTCVAGTYYGTCSDGTSTQSVTQTTTMQPSTSTTQRDTSKSVACSVCEDHFYCGRNPGYPVDMCSDEEWGWEIRNIYCPVMCDTCVEGSQYGDCVSQSPTQTVTPRSTTEKSQNITRRPVVLDECRPCVNHRYCGVKPGWPLEWCDHPEYGYEIRHLYCPVMCGLCENGTWLGICTSSTTATGSSTTVTTKSPSDVTMTTTTDVPITATAPPVQSNHTKGCNLTCQNCGTFREDTCSCACALGWSGEDCSRLCLDFSLSCGQYWTESWCSHPDYGDQVKLNCPLMCGQCLPVMGMKPGLCLDVTITTSPTNTANSLEIPSILFMMINAAVLYTRYMSTY